MRVHGDQYAINQPDIIGCFQGQCFCIEVKRAGKKSRLGQLAVQRRWAKAGAIVIQDATCVEDVRHEFSKLVPKPLDKPCKACYNEGEGIGKRKERNEIDTGDGRKRGEGSRDER